MSNRHAEPSFARFWSLDRVGPQTREKTHDSSRIRKQWRAVPVLLLGLGLSACLSARAEAHLGDRVYPIPYLSDEMLEQIQLHDGLVDEWYELVGEPTMSLLDFTEELYQSPLDPSDIDFRIWLAWHDEPARLYVGLVASDDVYKNTHDYNSGSSSRSAIYTHDSIKLAIDGDHSGGAGSGNGTPLEEVIEIQGQAPDYEAIPRTVSGPTLNDGLYRFQKKQTLWTTVPPYGDSGGGVAGEAPVIWVIELYVTPFDRWGETWGSPEGSVVSHFAAGQVIGFAVVVIDHDPPEIAVKRWSVEVQQSDETDTTFWNIIRNRADSFLDGLLLPADPAGPGDSAVESVSWGRIKASLVIE